MDQQESRQHDEKYDVRDSDCLDLDAPLRRIFGWGTILQSSLALIVVVDNCKPPAK